MSTITDPAVRRTLPSGDWLTLSARLTDELPALSGRRDLVAGCAPGAGHGAAACYLPHEAAVEVDGTILGTLAPASLHPARPLDRYRYPALWGAFIHEAAHARHSRWLAPDRVPRVVTDAAELLEESRIEALHLQRRPEDRDWLRACVTTLVTAQLTPAVPAPPGTTSPPPPATTVATAPPVTMSLADAGRTAGLLLARVDATVLTAKETARVHATVRRVLGTDRLTALRRVWRAAHRTGDTNHWGMIKLAEQWCEILDIDPTAPSPPSPQPSGAGAGEPGGPPSTLGNVIADAFDTITATTSASLRHTATTTARAQEAAARTRATQAAKTVFSTPTSTTAPGTTADAYAGSRPPTPDEQAAARSLARALRAAGYRERAATTLTSPVPPGRLRMRGALAADAQRAAGAVPTARPFTRVQRRTTPTPPLRIAVAADISGTMRDFARPVASTAWILAAAAGHVPDATATSVLFGDRVLPLTFPGAPPATVAEFRSRDLYEQFCGAVDALDAACELTRPGAARLLVIVSDGRFKDTQRAHGQQRLDRLRAHGCTVLWITPDDSDATPLDTDATLTLAHPAQTASHIARAALRALTTTR
ncbi:VWA containing CoxE family protein [Frankia sp. AgPm24]|uniref:VWA containing CoxE family protein n=1 Tax=Frankia sp. AgPm24 TaxID=631128 RepID=UPI00200DF4B3|nr:VWA containing CoxE family protein [Frankia sp. AgPm24]MCK9921221.1 VWA containing CoxE family protein [Frankia sp. AgPm24]